MSQNHIHHPELMQKAQYLSVAVALSILTAKVYGWVATDSVSIFASLIDSLLDVSASAINLVAMRMALAPPDHDHRFGHDKIEDLAIFAQSMFFFASGLFTMFVALRRFISPEPVESFDTGLGVMVFAMTLTFGLVIYQSYVIKKTHSRIVAADKLHYLVDFLSNMVVVVSIYLSSKWIMVDSICGILIAVYIIHSSYGLFIQASKNLIDQEFSDEERGKILSILAGFNKDVLGVHELKTRHAGRKPFIQFHAEMKKDISLMEAHEISEKIVAAIEEVFQGAEVTVHQDPYGYESNVNYREVI